MRPTHQFIDDGLHVLSADHHRQEFKDWEFMVLNKTHLLVYWWWPPHPLCRLSQTRVQEFKGCEFTALNKTHSLVYWWWPPHPLCWLSQTRVQVILGLFPAHIPLTGQLVWKIQKSIHYSWKWTHLQPLALFAFPHINLSPKDAIFKTKQNKKQTCETGWNTIQILLRSSFSFYMLTGQSLPNLKGSLTLCILMSYIDHFQLLLATRSAAVWAKKNFSLLTQIPLLLQELFSHLSDC